MKTIALGAFATALLASAASAAPLNPTAVGSPELSGIDQGLLVCNEYAHCFRTRGPRYVQRYSGDDDGYVVRRSYGSYGAPGDYGRGCGYCGGRPSTRVSLAPGPPG